MVVGNYFLIKYTHATQRIRQDELQYNKSAISLQSQNKKWQGYVGA